MFTNLNHSGFERPTVGRLRTGLKILFGLAVIVITHESLIPVNESSVPNNWDKLVHFLAYFILTGLSVFAFPKARLLGLFALMTVLGGGIEIAQELMNVGRDGTWGDGLANMGGAAAPIIMWVLFRRPRSGQT